MTSYLVLFASAAIVNNFVLTRFLGLCIFFGVSKKLDASIGMAMAVTCVITLSSILAWVVYNFVLLPLNLIFMKTVVFVLLVAGFVQLLEMIIKKQAPALYGMWGIYLLLIATNCVVLGVPLLNAESGFGFAQSVVNALGSGVGFGIAIVIMASLRERLELADVPAPLRGMGVAFIVAGMLSMAFLGFSGMI